MRAVKRAFAGEINLTAEDESSKAFAERLRLAMNGESARAFSAKIGVSPSAMNQYLGAKSEPTRPVLHAIAREAGVSLPWLITGEGAMSADGQAGTKDKETGNGLLVPVDASGFTPVPVFDVRASAGGGAINFGEVVSGYLTLPVSYLKDHLGVNPKDACGIYINGDSMEPALEDGAIALLDRSEDARANNGDGIYTFRIAEELYIKRLERQGSRIVVHSDNQAYRPWEISDHDKGQMKILARVVGSFRNL